jgi:hypothetical protein
MGEDWSRGRARVLACFAAFGAFWGAWGAALPAIQDAAGASDAELGLALLLVGAGALASMRAVGAVIDRRGSAVTPWAVAALGACALPPAVAGSPAQLAVALLVLGRRRAPVAINTEGVRYEKASGRPVLNLAHAAFSGAVVAASLLAGALRAAGAGAAVVLGLAGLALVAVAAGLAVSRPAGVEPPHERRHARLATPGWLLLLGGLCALAFWVENAWQSWSAVHLQRDLDAPVGISALGPAAFASAAMAGRLAGQRLVGVLGDRALIAAGAVSTVTTIAYLGFVVGPAVVGGVAGVTSLAVVAGLAAALALVTEVAPLPRRPMSPAVRDSPYS